jgi:hypothetical protein
MSPPPLERDSVLAALEVLLEKILTVDRSEIRDAARHVLDILECPPDASSDIDKRSRIRSGILGVLRVYEHPSNHR